ncbi:MAG: GIY-YIG nuclease family protein, partial [Syntrophaceae bacterium]|nr:GIY-YIG nuclease family protein [Syntrophaceae bacterium]
MNLLFDHFEKLIKAPDSIKKMRELILQLAVQGKLVPQDDDLPAPQPGKYWVYVVKCSNDSNYIGQTENLRKRWEEHLSGKGADWSRKYPPKYVLYWEELPSREEAVKREKWLKTGFGRKWIKREEEAGRLRCAGEPASELLKKIKAEKQKLIAEGKIKKHKPLPPIQPDEIPYELPKGWVWCRLNHCFDFHKRFPVKRGPFGSSIKKDFFVPKGHNTYKVYEQRNAIYSDPSLGNYYIPEEKFKELISFEVKPGDILVSCSGTIGKISILPNIIEEGIINQALLKLSINHLFISKKYFTILFEAFVMKTSSLQNLKGTAMKNIPSVSIIKATVVPVPPIEEQHRIVAKVDQLMALCDELEKLKEKRDHRQLQMNKAALFALLNSRTPEEFAGHWQRIADHFGEFYRTPENVAELKKAILQLAVQGKLAPQDDDLPAPQPGKYWVYVVKCS